MEDSRLVVGAATDPGPVRDQNEDAIYHSVLTDTPGNELTLMAVADGMGGHQRGEIASEMAIEALVERFSSADTDDLVLMLKQAYRAANERIYENGSADGEENLMGTTLVTAVVHGTDLAIANVGDSRAYLLRANNLNQISQDHSLVAEQVATGAITPDEARGSHHRNIITRALGQFPKVEADIFELTLLPEDRLLFSTDGLHDYLDEDEITRMLTTMTPEESAREMVDRAINAGSTDNVSAIVAWMAPVSVLDAPEPELVPAGGGMNPVMVAAILVALLIVIAIVGYVTLVM